MKKVLLVLLAIIVGIVIFASTQPDDFKVQREVMIKASPDKIYGHINDLHQWVEWSPYEKLDKNMKKTFGGANAGVGAFYEWAGNNDVGSGRMEVTTTVPSSKVSMKLDFSRPMKGSNTVDFIIAPSGGSISLSVNNAPPKESDAMTKVAWVMHGKLNLFSKVISLFCNMDAMIGKQFEEGLNNLKVLCER